MSRVGGLSGAFGKLKGRGPHEWKVRGYQKFSIIRDRLGWSDRVRVPSDAAFLRSSFGSHAPFDAQGLKERFERRSRERFFGGLSDSEETIRELRARWPDVEERVLREADRICAKRFHLLGREVTFSGAIDWLAEPVSGKRTDLRHWSAIDIHSAEVVGEYKVTWELNRHQYLVTLGKAYLYTRDERFAREFVSQVESWIEGNPPGRGVNWASSLELAFRVIAWTWALCLFRDSKTVEPGFFLQVMKFVHLQARQIETYLSTYFSPNTHLTGEALGLLYVGLMFPEFRAAPRWRQLGSEILASWMPRHVLDDGVYFERSTSYQRYTAEFLIHALVLQAKNDVPPCSAIRSGLERLLEGLVYISKPDGSVPQIGDDDGGQLLKLDDRPLTDLRAALATGAVLFERSDFRWVAGEAAETTLWLLGPDGIREFDSLDPRSPESESRGLLSGGYFVMRDGWAADANYCIVDCGEHGAMNCGHAHADVLAFELAANGQTLFVDPGTFTYAWPLKDRDYFRGTEAHNTLVVDGVNASVTAGPFGWSHVADAELGDWISRPSFDYFRGSHNGYERLRDPITHAREILFLKREYWVMRDTLSGETEHDTGLMFHVNPELRAVGDGPRIDLYDGAASLPLASLITFGPGTFEVEPSRVSPGYGQLVESSRCRYATILSPGQSLVSLVFASAEITGAERIDVRAGDALRVCGHRFEDTICFGLVRDDLDAIGIDTDFRLVWIRRSVPDRKLEQFVGINGSRLKVDGHIAFEAVATVEYAAWGPGPDNPIDAAARV